jgi:hypothetical protein
LNLFLYLVFKIILKNLLVQTEFYWSWAGGPDATQSFTGLGLEDLMLIMRNVFAVIFFLSSNEN